jgi:hypothetical protein
MIISRGNAEVVITFQRADQQLRRAVELLWAVHAGEADAADRVEADLQRLVARVARDMREDIGSVPEGAGDGRATARIRRAPSES